MRLAKILKTFGIVTVMMLLTILNLAATARAQLTVLSKGNPTLQWQKVQLAQIDAQLADKTIVGDLRLELEAQQQWLTLYQPGMLTAGSMFKVERQNPTTLIEPILDPTKKARSLRLRLLGPKAKPSIRDTELLKRALQDAPEDLGLRQLQLHWLDQPQYREVYPTEIADAAAKVINLLAEQKLKPQDLKNVTAFTLYRQARALGYRQDSDVIENKPLTDEELKVVQGQLAGVYQQLMDLVGPGHAEFVLLEIRMLRRDNWFGRALNLLEKHATTIAPRWYLEKRWELLLDLGWQPAAEEARKIFVAEFPAEAAKQ